MVDIPTRVLLPLSKLCWNMRLMAGPPILAISARRGPRLPKPATWLPRLAAMLAAPDGLERLERFTLIE